MYDHSRVVAQPPVELPGSNVDRVDARGACLQQTVGESAGGRSEVRGDESGDVEAEMFESAFELQSASSHIAEFRGHFNTGLGGNKLARLGCFLAIHKDITGHDQRLRFLAGVHES